MQHLLMAIMIDPATGLILQGEACGWRYIERCAALYVHMICTAVCVCMRFIIVKKLSQYFEEEVLEYDAPQI